MKISYYLLLFTFFSVAVRKYKFVSGPALCTYGRWCALHFTHVSLNPQYSPVRWVVLAPFYGLNSCSESVPISSATVSVSEAELGVRPETVLPPGPCSVPTAEVAARGPHSREHGRCPPLRSVAPLCPALCLLPQTAFSLHDVHLPSLVGPHPPLGQDSLETWTPCSALGTGEAHAVWPDSLLMGSMSGTQSSRFTSRGRSSARTLGSRPD